MSGPEQASVRRSTSAGAVYSYRPRARWPPCILQLVPSKAMQVWAMVRCRIAMSVHLNDSCALGGRNCRSVRVESKEAGGEGCGKGARCQAAMEPSTTHAGGSHWCCIW